MKRRCIDPMTDEWQEWDEPLISLGFFKDREKDMISIRTAILLALALFFVCAASAILSPPRDTEQASLDRRYVWMMEDGR